MSRPSSAVMTDHDPRAPRPASYPGGITRRQFLTALGAGAATTAATALVLSPAADPLHGGHPHHLHAQQPGAGPAADAAEGSANVAMDQDAARTVRRPPKPGASPQLGKEQVDALEHGIKCQCGCTLDVYTCRTTDFSCQVSPAMHRDVLSLVEGGYTADEITRAFVQSYGEKVLMAPVKSGFNWAGYLMPFAALGAGGVVLATLIRRWGVRAAAVRAAQDAAAPRHAAGNGSTPHAVDGTPEELARLEAAVRGEDH